ncbi:stage III sporulation protein AF [Natranaerobius thermophilus]|uniref:Stage III sporulation protein AF n=1 Tax=Natranaerobius thermophilus (strain ATCC BAA-1301 / DSM 18059 / JW/NM-WN-LF) TaxID=457570 RepID=B2A540_NATTJ|nr:stage III sporulation protein AF [Natranaerobius thermophilus]ACB85282.1 stage III sporulation protein AF [Natranaerobius thermophilus JW/NM-WN-LF]
MLSTVNELITTIVVVIVLATFLELLLPQGQLQRYVRLVIGLLIVLIILNPIVSIIESENFMIEPDIFEKETSAEETDELIQRGGQLKEENIAEIDKEYEQMISKEIVDLASDYFEKLKVSDIELNYEEDMEAANYGEIKNMTVYLTQLNGKKEYRSSEDKEGQLVEPVKEVKINLNDEKQDDKSEKTELGGKDEKNQQGQDLKLSKNIQENKEKFKYELSKKFHLERELIDVEVIK